MSERNHNRRYDPYKDPRNNLRGIDREELEEWRQWANEWKRSGSRKQLRESVNKNRRNGRVS